MSEFIFQMDHVRKAFGDKVILQDVSVNFLKGAKIGVVGPNGMGKSTLLKIMAGKEEPSNGSVMVASGATVGLLDQDPELDPGKTVREVVEEGIGPIKGKLFRYNKISEELSNPGADYDSLLEEMGKLQEEIDAAEGWEIDSSLQQAMNALQCPDEDAKIKVLSGGERRRVALCRLLLQAPDLLLLDEPTNHLDAESILWLEKFLKDYKGSVISITHDRAFLDSIAQWICEVDRGSLYGYEGNYSTYLEAKQKRMEIQGQKDAKLAKRIKNELEWVRSSPKARQAKNRARLERYDQMVAEENASRKSDFTDIHIPLPPRLGSEVLQVKNLTKKFGDRILMKDLTFNLPRNGIVGVIGPNGVGKTTLFKMIAGLEKPTEGEIALGSTVRISYVDQNREKIDPKKTLWEVVSGGEQFIEAGGEQFIEAGGEQFIEAGGEQIPSRAYTASFGFKGSDQQKLAGMLSGGEKNRLNLALTLKEGGNLLLLDEPTNDLDVETLESMEEALEEFPGCAVVISHDRWFLDRLATHILAWEGTEDDPSRWYWFEGNFQAYQENRIKRLGEEASRPHMIRRKLTRG